MTSGLLPIGAIAGPQGLKGHLKVKPFTQMPQTLAAYGPVSLDDGRKLTLSIMSVNAKGLVIARAAEVQDRDAAASLRGQTLYIGRECLPDLADDEFYHADLLGAAVITEDGTALGTIIALHDFGVGEIVEVGVNSGPSVMLPFNNDVIIDVDLAAHQVRLSVPDGYLDAEPAKD